MTAKSAKTSPASGIEISILVPVMNESGNIAPLVDEICAALAGRSFEIIYVDDASNDDSPAELAATAARVPQLRVLRHEARAGQSAAIRSALLASRGRLIGVLDGDGQNVPADFPALEAALVAQCPADGQTVGMAAGIRAKRKDNQARLLASRAARWIRRTLLADTHPDSGCGIKVLHRSLFLQLALLQPHAPVHAEPCQAAWRAGDRGGCGAQAARSRHVEIPHSRPASCRDQ